MNWILIIYISVSGYTPAPQFMGAYQTLTACRQAMVLMEKDYYGFKKSQKSFCILNTTGEAQ